MTLKLSCSSDFNFCIQANLSSRIIWKKIVLVPKKVKIVLSKSCWKDSEKKCPLRDTSYWTDSTVFAGNLLWLGYKIF